MTSERECSNKTAAHMSYAARNINYSVHGPFVAEWQSWEKKVYRTLQRIQLLFKCSKNFNVVKAIQETSAETT